MTGAFPTSHLANGTFRSELYKSDSPSYTCGKPLGSCDITRSWSAKAGGRAYSP